MRNLLSALIVIPLFVVIVAFCVANRHDVTVSFDPFNSGDPSLSRSLPLFALLIVVAALGVVAGGSVTWFRQRRWRKAARRHEADARAVRSELADLRAASAASRYETQRLPAPSQAGLFGPAGRDKQRATL